MSGVQYRTIGPDEADQRLDRWLRKQFPQLSQGLVEKLCRRGEVRVDGGRAKAATRVAPGQVIRVPPLPEAPAPRQTAPPPVDETLARDLRSRVLYRDDDVIALDKPPGLAVQGGTGQRTHLAGALSCLRFGREDDPRLVHRLDRDTSGVLLLARTGRAAVGLAKAFRGRGVDKLYLAAVAGRPKPAAGTVRYALEKAGGERMVAVHPDEVATHPQAQSARSDYRVVASAGTRASWVALRPVTGRTHQLRVHMAALGTPVVGDGRYGGRGRENQGDGWGASLGQGVSRKLHLHARRLRLSHPVTGRSLAIEADLPEHMCRTWAFFGWLLDDLPDEPFAEVDT